MNVLAIHPRSTAIAEAIDAAFFEDHPQYAEGTKPPRRLKHEFRTPHQYAYAEVVRESIAGKVEYQLHIAPQDHLIGKGALSNGYFALATTPWAIGVFKAALKNFLPSLEDSFLASLDEGNFVTKEITVSKYVKFETESMAMQALWGLHGHCKIVLDSGEALPKRKGDFKTPMQMVSSDPLCRNAFRVSIPGGEIKVSLMRDSGEYPTSFGDEKDQDKRIALYECARTLLCFDVAIKLETFRYLDDDGVARGFPLSFRDWTKANLPTNPNQSTWSQVMYELWLNVDLASTESEVNSVDLSRTQQKTLDAYLAGESMLSRNLLPSKFEEAKSIHEALVKKARVNILTPWAVNKLHQGKVFREMLKHINLFDPGADADLMDHTLSMGNVRKAMEAFSADMQGFPGWTYTSAD